MSENGGSNRAFMGDHDPRCRLISFNEYAAEHDLKPPSDPDWGSMAGFAVCHPDCPSLADAVALGRELAERYGW
jgi:hypothetical protein